MISALPSRVRPYIDTTTQGPGTIQPEPLKDAPPLDARRATVIDNLLGMTSDGARKRMVNILQVFPTGTLEALYKHGMRFNITKKPSLAQQAIARSTGMMMLGGYDPRSRNIQFMEATVMGDLGPHTVTHEVCHAIDHMRGERNDKIARLPLGRLYRVFSQSEMESSRDPEIRNLYQHYQARINVEDVDVMRREVLIANDMKKPLPERASIVSDFDHWGLRPVTYERKNGVEKFTIEPTVQQRNTRVGQFAIGATLVAAGFFGAAYIGAAALPVGCLMVGFAALGAIRGAIHKHFDPRTEVDVELRTAGAKAHVIQQDERSIVTLPEGARAYTGDSWSDYAHRGNMGQEKRGEGEYVAEAYSTYLQGGTKAQEFLDADPDMYHFVEQRLSDEFKRHP